MYGFLTRLPNVLKILRFPDSSSASQMIDILDDSYESNLTDEEHERLILMSEHAIAPPLSSAAQAVLNAYRDASLDDGATAAAVLRTVADQLGEEMTVIGEGFKGVTRDELSVVHVPAILAIASELEAL